MERHIENVNYMYVGSVNYMYMWITNEMQKETN